jgi:hypothetical protein
MANIQFEQLKQKHGTKMMLPVDKLLAKIPKQF